MKKLLVLPAVLAMVSVAQANLLTNGDFGVGTDRDPGSGDGQLATGWFQWVGGGWNNRELSANGLAPDNYHLALGNAGATDNGAFQIVPATAGLEYQLNLDAGSPDGWWLPAGEAKIEFLDAADALISEFGVRTDDLIHIPVELYDTPLPWANFNLVEVAPAGTTQIRVIVMNQGPQGGTMRFDNVSLTVVPEPASLALLSLGGLMLASGRRR